LTKRKLQRFAEIGTFDNVIQPSWDEQLKGHALKGNWNETFFKNDNPLVLELGCGKGEYTVGMAEKFPEKNFIGVDLKGNWRGAKTAIETGLKNVAFVRTRIEMIQAVFGKDEVAEIWITFPDPQPQESREKKRLTSMKFLNLYRNILVPRGVINLKTDNAGLYRYTFDLVTENKMEVLDATDNLYASKELKTANIESLWSIQTFYEKKFSAQGHAICYLKFRL
jgi:tRNA (guanine-N7-)-methyltransferase